MAQGVAMAVALAGQPAFEGPVAVRCHADGRLFVTDDLGHRIVVMSRGGEQLVSLGRYGSGPGELLWPDAVHWDASGSLYVADAGANRVQVWDQHGVHVRDLGRPLRWRRRLQPVLALLAVATVLGFVFVTLTSHALPLATYLRSGLLAGAIVAGSGWAFLSTGFQGLQNPRDVLVGEDGLVYVADFNGNAIRVFEATGRLVRTIGELGAESGELNGPLGLARSADGRLFVADSRNHRIQVFAADGGFVASFGRHGTRAGEFEFPHGLAFGPDDLLYVADRGNRRIQILTQDGSAVRLIQGDGADGREAFTPAGICVTADGAVWLADIDGHRVLYVDHAAVSLTSPSR